MQSKQLMTEIISFRSRWAVLAAVVAVAFGILTVIVGGQTLFGSPVTRAAAGNIVPFVLWFNFFAGFAYIAAGFGLFLWKNWAALLSAVIAIATLGGVRGAWNSRSAWRRIRGESRRRHDHPQHRLGGDRSCSVSHAWMPSRPRECAP